MTYKEVYQVVSSIHIDQTNVIPCVYWMFPEDDPTNPPPPPPFLVYYYTESNDLLADGINYQKIRGLTVELYCDNKDFNLEKAVEDALTSNGFVYAKSEDYIESEKLYMTTFESEVIITNG